MENLSDSNISTSSYNTENNVTQINTEQNIKKKRGRPKKTNIITKQTGQKIKSKSKKEEKKEELILHLPIYEETHKSSEKNIFIMKDEESLDGSEKSSKENEYHNSQSLLDSSKLESNKHNLNKQALMAEIKKRDIIIKKLKENNIETKRIGQCLGSNKEMEEYIIDLKLIDINNNKPIVIDKTNIACWWCSHQFNTMPCFIPDRYVNEIFYVIGCFCTYNCALSYAINILNDHKLSTRITLIKQLYSKIFKNNNINISMAPPKELLKMFGGTMSIEEFRNKSKLCTKEYKINIPTIVQISPIIEEKIVDTKPTVVHLLKQKNFK